jgi:hypothetical protein
VERREHGKLELKLVFAGDLEGNPLIKDVLGDFNVVDLQRFSVSLDFRGKCLVSLTVSFLIR